MIQRLLCLAVLIAVAGASPAYPYQAAASPSPTPAPLAAGDVVTGFDAVGIDGLSRRVDFPKGSSTVVVFFTSSCPVCHRMLPVWSEYFARLPKTVKMVGVLVDREPPGFFGVMPITFPVVRTPGAELHRTYKVRHVPMTIRVGPGGKVEEVGEGVLDPIRLGQIFRR
jgi:hypothetical protein